MYLPLFMKTDCSTEILIIGAGKAALSKLRTLSEYPSKITVISRDISDEIMKISNAVDRINVIQAGFTDEMIEDKYSLVIAATSEKAVNERIHELCRKKKILVNAVDDPENCSVIFPSSFRDRDVILAVSSSGKNPVVTQYVRDRIEKAWPEGIGKISDELFSEREDFRKERNHKKRAENIRREIETRLEKRHEKILRIGTRGSALAMIQTKLVEERIRKDYPNLRTETVIIRTKGDVILDRPLADAGGKGLFTGEIERALDEGRIDLAVHSAKDVPTEIDENYSLTSILDREDRRDALVFTKDYHDRLLEGKGDVSKKRKAEILLDGATVGTSGPRRCEMISRLSAKASTKLIRGNVPTRMKKLLDGEYDGIVLAMAGINRLTAGGGLEESFTERFVIIPLDEEIFVPAAGQGIIVCETKKDSFAHSVMEALVNDKSQRELESERAFLDSLCLGCHDAAGVSSHAGNGKMTLTAFVENSDIKCSEAASVEEIASIAGLLRRHVIIAGAGPMAEDLVTVRTMDAIKKADVIVHDALIDEKILENAKGRLIPAGKRAGRHSMKQEDINSLLIREANKGKLVLRLKGGDPFVFGRALEECDALKKAGIEYSLIPGVTSATAAPLSAGIPLTFRKNEYHKRGSRGFMVLTAHSGDDAHNSAEDPLDFSHLAAFEGSIVFLMGLGRLERITEGLIGAGMNRRTPVAVISSATSKNEFCIRSTLESISEKVLKEKRIKAPAVIVVGECAGINVKEEKPSVTVTGTEGFCERLAAMLENRGFRTESCPHLRTVPIANSLSEIEEGMKGYTHIVFTGRTAARLFLDRMTPDKEVKLCAIGRPTADFIKREYGLECCIVPRIYDSAAFAEEIIKQKNDEMKVLIPRAEKGNDELAKRLDEAGIRYRQMSIYKTEVNEEVFDDNMDTDYTVFASSLGARLFHEKTGRIPGKAVAIGKFTRMTLEELGAERIITAENASMGKICDIIEREEERR